MNNNGKQFLSAGIILLTLAALWTARVQKIDVGYVTLTGTNVGFYSFNSRFHRLTGVNMALYTLTDWLGLVPVAVCAIFSLIGIWQLVQRKSLLKVDADIILLGIYYAIVILVYIAFEIYPVNYRPILIAGRLEASYPSSTTLLVLAVMPSLTFQSLYRLKNAKIKTAIRIISDCFSRFMVISRLICGVHWATDIAGAILMAGGMFYIYKGAVILYCQKH